MKFLCLAYGHDSEWDKLDAEQQNALLANDAVIRDRGNLVSPVGKPTVVRTWDGTPHTDNVPYASGGAPLAGFAVLEAASLEEAIALVAYTPCAVAKGAIEIRPFARV